MEPRTVIYLNTSNKDKLAEYNLYLGGKYRVLATKKDLEEPEADPITIIRYKASQFENVLVDDVSFDILSTRKNDPASPGSNIRWVLERLKDPEYLGLSAIFSCLLAIRKVSKIYVYSGRVKGKIVEAKGEGFGFGPCFLPDGLEKTLGEEMVPEYNARYLAIQNFLNDRPEVVIDLLPTWDGTFQGHSIN